MIFRYFLLMIPKILNPTRKNNIGVLCNMNRSLLLIFLMQVLTFAVTGDASEQQAVDLGHEEELGVAKYSNSSPSGRYYCTYEDKENLGYNGNIWHVYLNDKKNSNKKILIFTSPRGAYTKWAPVDNFFAILDYVDGHGTNIYIYSIDTISSPNEKQEGVRLIYYNPDANIINNNIENSSDITNAFWDIVSWDIPHGKVKIECRYRGDMDEIKRHVYDIPIFPAITR